MVHILALLILISFKSISSGYIESGDEIIITNNLKILINLELLVLNEEVSETIYSAEIINRKNNIMPSTSLIALTIYPNKKEFLKFKNSSLMSFKISSSEDFIEEASKLIDIIKPNFFQYNLELDTCSKFSKETIEEKILSEYHISEKSILEEFEESCKNYIFTLYIGKFKYSKYFIE